MLHIRINECVAVSNNSCLGLLSGKNMINVKQTSPDPKPVGFQLGGQATICFKQKCTFAPAGNYLESQEKKSSLMDCF